MATPRININSKDLKLKKVIIIILKTGRNTKKIGPVLIFIIHLQFI